MKLLYVETNFPICIAKGQDPVADQLLSEAPAGSLAFPAVCFMEAFSVLGFEQAQLATFFASKPYNDYLGDGRRDDSPDAAEFVKHLRESKNAGNRRFGAIRSRLYEALLKLLRVAELVDTSADAIRAAIEDPIIEDPTDDLILASIREHAAARPGAVKRFLSGDSKAFGSNRGAKAILRGAGIESLKHPKQALDWLRAGTDG